MNKSGTKHVAKVSVLMSVHNGERFLREAVDSILGQTFADFEFIIVDDSSTDGTEAILNGYHDPRIVRLRNETNLGLTKSLNRGLAVARGMYIARMDADDTSDPSRIEKELAVIEDDADTRAVFSCFRRIDAAGQMIQDVPVYFSPEAIYLELFFNNCLLHGTALIEKEFLQRAGGYDESLESAQDYELWNRLKSRSRLVMLPEILYSYRDHQEAVSRNKAEMQERFFLKQFRANLNTLTDGQSREWDDDFVNVMRAVGRKEIRKLERDKAEAALDGVLSRIYQEMPAFLDGKSMEQAITEYKRRFIASTVVSEHGTRQPADVKAALLEQAEKNLERLPDNFVETHQDTQVTIVILSWNRLEQTKQAIQSLLEHVSIPYQLLVIDNNSEPSVKEQLKAICGERDLIDLILLDNNLGCAGGRHYAMDHVKTEYVMFMDNDIEVFPGTVEHLRQTLELNPEIVACGGNIVFPSGLVHVCGADYEIRDGILFYKLLGSGNAFDDQAIGQSGQCKWVNGGATMFRMQTLAKHPYDPSMRDYYEDLEWCYRLNQEGQGHFYRCVEALFLHHHESKVPDASISIQKAMEQSMPFIMAIAYFYEKHGAIIQNICDFVPELVCVGGKLNAALARIFLDWFRFYGPKSTLERWQQGRLSPLFSLETQPCKDFVTVSGQQHRIALPCPSYQRLQILTEKWSGRALTLRTQLAEKEKAWAEQEAEQQAVVENLTSRLNDILSSRTWRWANKAWVCGQRLVPGFLLRRIRGIPPPARQLQEVLQSRTRMIGSKLWSIARHLLPNRALVLMRQLIPPPPVSSFSLPPAVSKADEATADVFVFPVIDWHFRVQRPQHLAMEMANAGHRVFYFSVTFGLPYAGLPFRVTEVIHDRILLVELVCPQPQPNVYTSVPNTKQQRNIVNALNNIRRQYNVAGLVSLVDHPFWAPMATALQGNIIIYDCMDHHAGFADNGKHVATMETLLLRQADLVLTSSAPLRELIRKAGRDNVLIRNAAQVEFFSKRPNRLAIKHDRPIIGYYGALAEWFDIKLLTEVAKDNPQWAFELVGSTRGCDIAQASRLPNVTFHDEVPYAVLPKFLYAFDVCLIPFKRIPLTECTNPVKIYEYLAAGKPVVATPLPELQAIGDIIHLASTPAEFAAKISTALADAQNEDSAKRRRDWAQQHSWKHRGADLQTAIDSIQKKASVIILTYNNIDFTKTCLESLQLYTDYPDWELILVDNASTDGTPDYLKQYTKQHAHVKLILNSTNVGFPAGNNIGIKAATGEYLVLLNNDTHVTRGWLTDFLRPLRLDPRLGLVGPVTNNIGNEAKIDISYKDMNEMADAARRYTSTHSRQLYPVENVAFFCAALRRDVLDKVGLLDEVFGQGFFEDDDYCNRVRQAGYRIAIAEDVFIHHQLAASFNALPDNGREAQLAKNRSIYEAKWGPWVPHRHRPT